MNKVSLTERHKNLLGEIHELYKKKNKDYGNSFHDLYQELGIISATTQIVHKVNRLKKISKDYEHGKAGEVNESLRDTLIDAANYCILTAMELDMEEESKNGECNDSYQEGQQ